MESCVAGDGEKEWEEGNGDKKDIAIAKKRRSKN